MTNVTRRIFIGGLGASAAAALASVRMPRLSAQQAKPRRFVFVVSGNGYDATITMSPTVRDFIGQSRGRPFNDAFWWGTRRAEGHYSASQTEPVFIEGGLSGAPGLRGFERTGLLDRCAMLYGLSSMIAGGGHNAAHGVLSSTRTIGRQPGGVTIDEALARLDSVRGVGSSRTPRTAVRIGASSRASQGVGYGLCASGPRGSLPVIYSPSAVWSAYVRPFVEPDAGALLDHRERLLRLARADALGTRDELGMHPREAVEMLAAVDTQVEDTTIMRDRIQRYAGRLAFAPPEPDSVLPWREGKQFPFDVVASSFEADLARVAVVSLGAGDGDWNFLYDLGPISNVNPRHGAMYHPFGGIGATSAEMTEKAQRRSELREAWSLELDAVASLAARLEATPEPDHEGTMLDHTVITYVPGNGVGHHALPRDFPALIVGGANLGLVTNGRAILYPDVRNEEARGRRELLNLWNTYAVALGGAPADPRDGSLTGFGDPSVRLAGGVLPELLDCRALDCG